MAPPAAPRAADADVLCFRFGRPGLRQPISAPVPLYARPAGHSDQRPLSDRYLAAPVAVGVRVARHGEGPDPAARSEEHTSELQSLMRISYAVFCLKNKNDTTHNISA